MNLKDWTGILTACVPIVVALVGIIPTVINNRKKTQESIEALKIELQRDTAETNKKVDAVNAKLKEHLAEEEEHRAKQARYRILRFYDEICEGKEHSESHWEDVLDDCTFYKQYCHDNPKFKNSRCTGAIAYLGTTYHKIKVKGGFLTHKEGGE